MGETEEQINVGWSGEYTVNVQQAGWESLSYVIIGATVIYRDA